MSDSIAAAIAVAESLIAEKRFQDALVMLLGLSREHPGRYDVRSGLGRAYFFGGQYAEAEQAFRKAVQLQPDARDAHFSLGVSLTHQGKFSESVEPFLGARRLDPSSPDIRKALLQSLTTLLQRDTACEPSAARTLPALVDRALVSVVVPTRNRVRLLKDALGSIHRQRYPHWEAIVVNDGGEDVSPALDSLPREIRDRVLAVDLPSLGGPAAARNAALKQAKGQVIAFLDDDDLYLPHHLDTLVCELRSSNAGLAYSATDLVREVVEEKKRMELSRQRFQGGIRYSRALLLVGNFVPINAWAVRRECFGAVGPFDESFQFLEDWEFLLRVSAEFRIRQSEAVTAEYRVTDRARDSISKRNSHREGTRAVYRRHDVRGPERVVLARELYLETLS